MFNLLTCIFIMGPSLIGIYFFNKLCSNKTKLNYIKYLIYLFISNFIIYLSFWLFNRPNEDIYTKICEYSNYALIYASLLILINLMIGFIDYILERNCEIKIEEHDKKEHKKNNKNH